MERGTSHKTAEDRCASQDVHVDPAQRSLMTFSAKKVCLREGVPQGGVLSPTLFLVYNNDILTTITKMVSNMQTAWQSGMHLVTPPLQHTGSKKPSMVSTSGHRTGVLKYTSAKQTVLSFSLFTSKEQIKLRLKDEIVPQIDTLTFLGVYLDTRLTWKPRIEKMEKSSLQKLAPMRKFAGFTSGAD